MSGTSRALGLMLPIAMAALLGTAAPVVLAQAEAVPSQALVPPSGPAENTRITEAYARLVARDAWFWAWPMVNMYNRRLAYAKAPEQGLIGGTLPIAPHNRLTMLSDYIKPDQRSIACPNQDVVYGAGYLALNDSPVVIQIPDFGKRFWVIQLSDLRTESINGLGVMYGTKPGFIWSWGRTGRVRCPRALPE